MCRELGVGFVPFSPLGRGFFSGKLRSVSGLDEDDFRRTLPRFQPENFERNLALIDALDSLSRSKGCAPAQLALAWVLAQDDHIVPIPGSKRRSHLEENLAAANLGLSAEELRLIDAAVPKGAASGARYGETAMASVNR